MQRTLTALVAVLGLSMLVLFAQGTAYAQGADDPGQVEAGQAVYEMSCAGCHGADGMGVAGRGRPLIGIANQGDRATHIASITDGKGGMPAFGERLSEEEIDQAASYVRLTFVDEPAVEEPAADEPAATETTELALTGVNTTGLAIVGVTMLAGGVQLVTWSRRRMG